MFNIDYPIYGTILVISIFLGLIFILINLKELKYNKSEIFYLVVYILVGILFGAKYYDLVVNFHKYKSYDFVSLGLSSYGAVIGILIMLFIYSKQFKKNFVSMLSAILPSVPLIYAIGKIGCFISGCCYGIMYDGIFNVKYNYSNSAPCGVSLFPIQILETLIFIFKFIIFYKKRNYNNKINYICYLMITCGFFKFVLDFFRNTHEYKIITSNQIVSFIFILGGIFVIYLDKKRKSLY